MHVLHILEATSGGTRRHVLDLLPALKKRGIDCTLVASPLRYLEFARDAEALRRQGVQVIEVAMARGFDAGLDWQAIAALGGVLRANHYDVVHCHSTKAGMLGRLARLRFAPHTPLVYTPHCIAFDTGLPHAQRRAARIAERLFAAATSHFIAVSQHEQRALLARGLCRQARLTTIYNGVDLGDLQNLPRRERAEFGLCDCHFVIGCFGRLTRQKNQGALIAALPALLQQVPRSRLLLVGGGEDEAALRAAAQRLGVAHALVWAGEQSEARALYALCDVVVQPSRWEGCPYSVLEAMASERIVMARAVGGVPEIIGERYGIAYATSEGGGLGAAQLETLVRMATNANGWRQTTQTAARERVKHCFGLQRMVDQTAGIYQRVLNAN
jgi:glycosyltransferase involved in cell wall biosynthesis